MAHPLFLPRGGATEGGDPVADRTARAGWEFTALRVIELRAGGERALTTGTQEIAVLPLSGSCVVECDGLRCELQGRARLRAGQRLRLPPARRGGEDHERGGWPLRAPRGGV